jgi:3-hydroxybutyryl-CoA dehydrogenase
MQVLKKAVVVGSGLMGSQIALVLAAGSRELTLMDVRKEALDRTLGNIRRYLEDLERYGLLTGVSKQEILSRIRTTTSLEEAVSETEMVVEAVFENEDLKRQVFSKLDKAAPPEAILASNTSSIPITKLAGSTLRPERVVGSHFVQPAHIVPIVEVVMGQKTSDSAARRCCEIWRSLGKIPLLIKVDLPGFLVNRLQHAIIREATSLLAQGIASAEDIDTAVSVGLAPRFMTAGPLEQRDINGIKMHFDVASYLWKELDGFEIPLSYLKKKVDRGEIGLQAGKGYYDWKEIDPVSVRKEKDEALIRWTSELLAWRKVQDQLFHVTSVRVNE